MQLHQLDLNLLVTFDAIYGERNLTRAARRLHLAQSTLSHALGRLRGMLGDPLFQRRTRDMVPTPFARRIAPAVAQALATLQQGLATNRELDPGSMERRFVIGMRDVLEAVWLPPLMARLRTWAPNVELLVARTRPRRIEAELRAGTVDLCVDVTVPVSGAIDHEPLVDDRLYVIARGNRRARPQVGFEDYLSRSHVRVSSSATSPAIEDLALQRLGRRRHIALRCQSYFVACQVVRQTDLLLTVPSLYLPLRLEGAAAVSPLPFSAPAITVHQYWHSSASGDPAHRWLRAQMSEVARAHATSGDAAVSASRRRPR